MVSTSTGRLRCAVALGVLISLSVPSAEPRKCYWCGPLAEQVHRSRRAAACDTSAAVTTCDDGYPYCAIVVTSPPYIESRYCVKIYQDECYPLYCNTTKTWRMTCPCRGELCNGPNTDREKEAIEVLSKLVIKTNYIRIKKRFILAPTALTVSEEITDVIVYNKSEITSMNESQNNEILPSPEMEAGTFNMTNQEADQNLDNVKSTDIYSNDNMHDQDASVHTNVKTLQEPTDFVNLVSSAKSTTTINKNYEDTVQKNISDVNLLTTQNSPTTNAVNDNNLLIDQAVTETTDKTTVYNTQSTENTESKTINGIAREIKEFKTDEMANNNKLNSELPTAEALQNTAKASPSKVVPTLATEVTDTPSILNDTKFELTTEPTKKLSEIKNVAVTVISRLDIVFITCFVILNLRF